MAPETKKPVKGILKKPKASTTSPASATAPHPAATTNTTTSATKPDARAIAIRHAQLLEDRKAIEATIFDNILTLLDYPLHPSRPPASAPHPSDVDGFASLVRMFQPSDYDDMIVERNVSEDRCGYALCPKPRRRYPGAGTYKMINKGRRDFDIVETRELEKWCSTECTRRALWIKVQLNETAAWERVGLPELKIDLYPERETTGGGGGGGDEKEKEKKLRGAGAGEGDSGDGKPQELPAEMAKLQLEQDRKSATDNAALAIERGDVAKEASSTNTRSVDVVIREKTVTIQAEVPSLGEENTIEGYKAKFGSGMARDGHESDDDSDWII